MKGHRSCQRICEQMKRFYTRDNHLSSGSVSHSDRVPISNRKVASPVSQLAAVQFKRYMQRKFLRCRLSNRFLNLAMHYCVLGKDT